MKKLQLENFGVQELDAKEMKSVDGRLVWALEYGRKLRLTRRKWFLDFPI